MADVARLVLSAVSAALAAKDGVVTNKAKSQRLLALISALDPPIRGLISSGKLSDQLHGQPLRQLLAAVQRASELLKKQETKSYLSAFASHTKTRESFADVEREITACMGAMQLSLAVGAGNPAADDRQDRADMLAALRDLGAKADGLAEQMHEVDEEHRTSAQAVMEALQAGAAKDDEIVALLKTLVKGSERQPVADAHALEMEAENKRLQEENEMLHRTHQPPPPRSQLMQAVYAPAPQAMYLGAGFVTMPNGAQAPLVMTQNGPMCKVGRRIKPEAICLSCVLALIFWPLACIPCCIPDCYQDILEPVAHGQVPMAGS